MDGDMSQYAVDIDLGNPNTSHTQIVDLVGRDKRVLDLGCWTGDLGRVLIGRGCRVSGLEIDPTAADKARGVLDEVVVADLNTSPASEHFPEGAFDVVILGDVLEHLWDPVSALADARRLLTPGGRIVVSIPNVSHGSVRLALLQGRWDYTDTGLLDATHIRFFTRSSLLDLFVTAGLLVDDLRGTLADPLVVEVRVDADRLPPTVIEWVRHERDALVYQFVVAARAPEDGEDPAETARMIRLVPAVPEESIRAIDRYTAALAKDREERHQVLTVRDHIIGLEAAAASAQTRADRAEHELTNARRRLVRKDERLKELRARIERLEREIEETRDARGTRRGLKARRRDTPT